VRGNQKRMCSKDRNSLCFSCIEKELQEGMYWGEGDGEGGGSDESDRNLILGITHQQIPAFFVRRKGWIRQQQINRQPKDEFEDSSFYCSYAYLNALD
jgi:hypothetical protein